MTTSSAALISSLPATIAVANDADSDLIALGRQLEEAFARWAPAHHKWWHARQAFELAWKESGQRTDPNCANLFAAQEECGLEALGDENNTLDDAMAEIIERIRATKARTLAGFTVKMRALELEVAGGEMARGVTYDDLDHDLAIVVDLSVEIRALGCVDGFDQDERCRESED